MDICRNVKNPHFAYDLDLALAELDAQGKQVECISAEELVREYLKFEGKVPIKAGELICMLADRLGKYELVADVFMGTKRARQEEHSAFIYQKALQCLLNMSDGKNLSNAVVNHCDKPLDEPDARGPVIKSSPPPSSLRNESNQGFHKRGPADYCIQPVYAIHH